MKSLCKSAPLWATEAVPCPHMSICHRVELDGQGAGGQSFFSAAKRAIC